MSTGGFNISFIETICDVYDFEASGDKAWKRIEGGMSQLTDSMYKRATKQGARIVTGCGVTAMSSSQQDICIQYSPVPASPPPTQYKAVFNTTTLGCLRHMDLSELISPCDKSEGLRPEHIVGIRALTYNQATKVAVKFSYPWWRRIVQKGGVSSSDLNIRGVVYPSWDDGEDVPHTIIISYTWAQDADRMAALIPTNDTESTDVNDPIVQLCFRDLITLWADHNLTMETLTSSYTVHHVMAWSHTPWTSGAYALFSPGQFKNIYKDFTLPLCDNKLNICGEAISAHHAWISGAIDSAYNAVYTWCKAKGYAELAEKLTKSPFGMGEGLNTAELDDNLLNWRLHLAREERQKTQFGKRDSIQSS